MTLWQNLKAKTRSVMFKSLVQPPYKSAFKDLFLCAWLWSDRG